MTISWYGEACFLLESGGIRVLIEPPQKESGINPPRLKSDILIFSSAATRLDPAERASDSPRSSEETFVVDGPGEYEVKGVNIMGINDGKNTIYNIKMDDIKIVHLGFLNKNLDNEKISLLNDPDVVLVPVGGLKDELLDAEGAMKVVNNLEPSIAIPMLYSIKGLNVKRAPLSVFLRESEAKDSPQPKLTIKKKDLTEEETKIVILEKV